MTILRGRGDHLFLLSVIIYDFDERNLSYRSLKTKQELQKIDLKIIEGKKLFLHAFHFAVHHSKGL